MYVVVGTFRFQQMAAEEKQALMERMGKDMPATARSCPGFRGLSLVALNENDMMTVWHWDTEADWDGAQATFAPLLTEYVLPNLAAAPERVSGEVVMQVTP